MTAFAFSGEELPGSADYDLPPASADWARPQSNSSTASWQPRGKKDVLALAGKLQDRSLPWNERDEALQDLTHIFATGGLAPDHADFPVQLKAVVLGLAAQLPDLRSHVVRLSLIHISEPTRRS
eukprot:2636-Prymnesium_polylepis.1